MNGVGAAVTGTTLVIVASSKFLEGAWMTVSLTYVRRLAAEDSERFVAVLVPERVERRWYDVVLQSHATTAIKLMLRYRGGPQVMIIDAPWHDHERTVRGAQRRLAVVRPRLPKRPSRSRT